MYSILRMTCLPSLQGGNPKKKSWLTAELLVKGSWRSWGGKGNMPPYGSEQQLRARGKTNSCWGWGPQNRRKSGAPYSAVLQFILLTESQDTIHHLRTTADDCAKHLDFSVPGQQTCEWWIAQEGEGHSANILTAVGRGQADNEQSPGVTMFLSFNYLGFQNCLNTFLSSSSTSQNSNSSAPLSTDMASRQEVLIILECSGDKMYFSQAPGGGSSWWHLTTF